MHIIKQAKKVLLIVVKQQPSGFLTLIVMPINRAY